jgi:ERCC4-type nuclease
VGRVVIDVHERRSRMHEELLLQGLDVSVRPLAVADYELGPALIERKRIWDLHLSIIQRRFWPQIGRLRDAAYFSYLLVEGDDLDAGPLRADSIRGALLAVEELGVSVIRSRDAADSAFWLAILASRMERRSGAPRRAHRRYALRETDGARAMLSAAPGISTGCAQALLDQFGSVADVIAAGPTRWLEVPGIGPVRAASLARILCHRTDALSRAQSARRAPST